MIKSTVNVTLEETTCYANVSHLVVVIDNAIILQLITPWYWETL